MLILLIMSSVMFSIVLLSDKYGNKDELIAFCLYSVLGVIWFLNPLDNEASGMVDRTEFSVDEQERLSYKINSLYPELKEKIKENDSELFAEEDLNDKSEYVNIDEQRMLWFIVDTQLSGIALNDHETVNSNEEALIKINLVHKSLGKDTVSSIEDYVVGRGIDESNARDVLAVRQGMKEMVTYIALIINKIFLVMFCFSVFYFGSKASKELYVSFKNKRNQKEKRIADLEEQLKEVKLLRKELKAMKRYNKKRENSIEIEME